MEGRSACAEERGLGGDRCRAWIVEIDAIADAGVVGKQIGKAREEEIAARACHAWEGYTWMHAAIWRAAVILRRLRLDGAARLQADAERGGARCRIQHRVGR